MNRTIELIKNRSDIGAGTRGSDLGVDAVEIAAINKGNHFFQEHPHVDVPTRNDSIYEHDINPYGKHIKQIYQQCRALASTVEDCLLRNNFPLVFSGDHSSAVGTISGIKAAYPSKTLGVIWIDAHADIHSPFTTPSGNMHGMPLAAVLQEDNLPSQINNVDEQTIQYWERLKNIAVHAPKLTPNHLVYFGVRDTEEPENILMHRLDIKNYVVDEVRTRGEEECVQEVLTNLSACDLLYVSFDVDSIDSVLIAEGTGTPVPKGFSPMEIVAMLQEIIKSGKVICLELAEVNPLLDKQGNKTAEVAFNVLEKIIPYLKSYRK